MVNTKKSSLWNRYIETRNPDTHKENKQVCNEVRKQTQLIEKKEQFEVAKQCKTNPKKFWKYINSKSELHTRIVILRMWARTDLLSSQ